VTAGSDARDLNDYPLPDGDIFPLGAPDGFIDLRDALLAIRILRGEITGAESEPYFLRHADVAPLGASGQPVPDQQFTVGDTLVIHRRVTGQVPAW